MIGNQPTHQPYLRGLVLSDRVRLWSLAAVKAHTGWDSETVRARIEEGGLPWAWDISAGRRRVAEARVWWACVKDTARASGADEAAVLADVLGERETYWAGVELARRFNCERDLIHSLFRAGDLRGAKVGHALLIEPGSVAEFLRQRRIQ